MISRIIEVANDFPNCSAVAVDLVPLQNTLVHRSFTDYVADSPFFTVLCLRTVGSFILNTDLLALYICNFPFAGAKSMMSISAWNIIMAVLTSCTLALYLLG